MTGSTSADVGILVLRVVAGITMAAHGYQKFFSGGRISGTGRWFDSMGMRPGRLHALAAATTELLAGIFLAAGLLTAVAGAAFVALMLVAGYTVHRANGFFSVRSGWEYNLVLATIGVAVAVTGPGRYSLDHVLGLTGPLSGSTGLLIAVAGGGLAGVGQLVIFFRPSTVVNNA
ncbi:MAG: putative oxidoreductase mhqP [Pseudonocardia sp.]|jgi:putative oxidoreductase|uniref:DoxX family protein n=1 Tax=Pseudonocardia sp. TaxID=60912 RepID=UPI0026238A33|nr:DoxX family protein [Pseudonocardia sp.]MCU1625699.1 putative oxidoreductase mhqP [Pseudonocardia sp.]